MKILSRYIAGKFFRIFLAGLAMIALLVFAADLFDRMNHLLKSGAGLGAIMAYLLLEVPYWTARVVPMATLLASLLCVTMFAQSGEWIAAQASGFSAFTVFKPILYCAMAVAGLSFLAQESVLPAAHSLAGRLWRDSIHPEWEWDKYYDVALISRPQEFIEARLFLPKAGRLERVLWERWDPERGVVNQIDAKIALWDGLASRWIFYDGVERNFIRGEVQGKPFSRLQSQLDTPPRQLIPRPKNPDELSLLEIYQAVQKARSLGARPRDLIVAAHAKIAYPFANLILAALGIPLALRNRHSGKIMSFCVALALSFLYIWCLEVSRTLGISGNIAPELAAWAPHVIFGGAAAILLKKFS